MRWIILFPLLTCLVHCSRHDIYNGFTVHEVKINTSEDQKIFIETALKLNTDIWNEGYPGLRDGVLMIDPEHTEDFKTILDQYNIQHSEKSNNVKRMLEEQDDLITQHKRNRAGRAATYDDYPRYAEVIEYIDQLAETYPNIVTLVTAGTSFEGREIKYVKISTSNFTDNSKPIIFMETCIHAREWVTIPVNLYALHKLLEDRKPEDDDLISNIDWIILPIVNPDGYEYTHTNERLWRRTRSFNASVSTTCFGVDGNRNFDYNFGQYGVSSDPCSDTWPGPYPFSEVETQYVRDILSEYNSRIEIFFDIHSYGNWILYGYDDVLAPNTNAMHLVGSAMGAQIDVNKLEEAPFYLVGNGAYLLYPTAGSAQDYAQYAGASMSYTLELPGYSWNFLVPPERINQINRETWEGIKVVARLATIFYAANNAM